MPLDHCVAGHTRHVVQVDAACASYAEKGAVRLEGIVSPASIAELTTAFDEVAAKAADCRWQPPTGATQNPLKIVRGDGETMATNMVPTHAAFRAFVEDTRLTAAVAETIGSATLRFWIDAVFEKRGGEGTPWHHDVCTWPFWGEQMPIVWVPLSDVGAGDAPLVTLDASHHGGTRYHSPFSRQDLALRPPYRPWQELLDAVAAPDALSTTWTMRAGDCLVIHPATIHASRAWAGATGTRRLAVSLRYLGDDARWAPDEFAVPIPALDAHPSMVRGAPPPGDLFPLIYA